MKIKLSIKAIILGSLVDIGGSLLLGVILGIIFGILYASGGNNINNISKEDYYSNISLMIISLLLGLCITSIGGFVAGKYSKDHETPNSIAVGVAGILFGLFSIFSLPLWYNIASFISIIPFAYLGGLIAKRNNLK